MNCEGKGNKDEGREWREGWRERQREHVQGKDEVCRGLVCVCAAVCVGGVSDGGNRFLIPFLQALRVTQMEDLARCSELLHGMLTEAGLSGEGPPASGDMTHLSAAVCVCVVCVYVCVVCMYTIVTYSSVQEYKARLSAAVQAVAAAKSCLLASLRGTSVAKMVAATKDYVQAVKVKLSL